MQELIDAGLLDPADARRHPQRNVITRSLGYEEAVAVDFSVLEPMVMRVLLCSDGLVGELDDAALDRSLSDTTAHPQTVADALVAQALTGEARDNVSAVVVDMIPSTPVTELDITAPRRRPRPAGRHGHATQRAPHEWGVGRVRRWPHRGRH